MTNKWIPVTLVLILLLSALSLIACGSDGDKENESEGAGQTAPEPTETAEPETSEETHQDQPASGDLPWDELPVFPKADLESQEECPAKWAECDLCEHRAYVTEESPEAVCPLIADGMSEKGWFKLMYQFYPEGSCMGTWMADESDTRVLMNAAQRRSDKKTFIAITMGQECP